MRGHVGGFPLHPFCKPDSSASCSCYISVSVRCDQVSQCKPQTQMYLRDVAIKSSLVYRRRHTRGSAVKLSNCFYPRNVQDEY